MNVFEYMQKKGLTEGSLDALAKPYETGQYPHEEGEIYSGSHLDAVGKRRVTVIYDAADTQKVAAIAKTKEVTPSEVYREALRAFLTTVS